MTRWPEDCVAPGAITADELVEAADGDAPAVLARHLDGCAACRDRAAQYARIDRALRLTLFRRSCPPSLTLGEYAIDTLPAESRRDVAAHLTECRDCKAEVGRFADALRGPEPEPHVGLLGALRRLVAAPVALPGPALAGLRGAGSAESVTYTAAGLRLTVSVQRSTRGGMHVIAGLLEDGVGEPPLPVARLYDGERLVQQQHVDDLGNFLFEAVPAGSYRIEVTVPVAIVVIEPVTVP